MLFIFIFIVIILSNNVLFKLPTLLYYKYQLIFLGIKVVILIKFKYFTIGNVK